MITVGNRWVLYNGRVRLSFPGFLLLVIFLTVVAAGFRVGPFAKVLGARAEKLILVAVGDVMLGRSVNVSMQRRNDWRWPFLVTADFLRSADITFGNLESPLIYDCPPTDTGMRFCGDFRAVEGLTFAGFDVLSLANNHIFNYGEQGFLETREILADQEIVGLGEGEVGILKRDGWKVAVVAFEDVNDKIQVEQVEQVVRVAQAQSDLVVVSVHWGTEYTDMPDARQQTLGRALIDAGADIVAGHHPHWVQPVERYGKGVIFYSLGNFVFDQMWSEETRQGTVAVIAVDVEGGIDYQLVPVTIYDFGQPRFRE